MSKEGTNAFSQTAELKNMEKKGDNHFGSFDVVDQETPDDNVLKDMEELAAIVLSQMKVFINKDKNKNSRL
ncbi:hypothetical protein P8452_03230 [Trifolium repens]|nr:hypothetical protein P8452_03230 [Trifolium repens]